MEKGKTSRYLKYAIGEIILVVIGILIALQINTWNESRKLKNNEVSILKDLIENLQNDYASFQIEKKLLEKQLQLVDELIIDPHRSPLAKTELNFLRYQVEVYPLTFENNIPKGIYNKSILERLKMYYRKQQIVLNDEKTYGNVVINLVRPYLRKHSIHNPEIVVVKVGDFSNLENGDFGKKLLNIEKLSKLYDSDELRQILLELRIKTAEFINDIDQLSEANKELIPVIKEYIQ
mgnify:CR=1 FL=1